MITTGNTSDIVLNEGSDHFVTNLFFQFVNSLFAAALLRMQPSISPPALPGDPLEFGQCPLRFTWPHSAVAYPCLPPPPLLS